MIEYSVVIPTYNRTQSLACVMLSLARQTLPYDKWEVIISDDGSNINNLGRIKKYSELLNFKYVWRLNQNGNGGPPRNLGVQSSAKTSDAVIFVDTDVILDENALEAHDRWHKKYPKCVILGRYDWLKPMVIYEEVLSDRFDDIINEKLTTICDGRTGPGTGKDRRWVHEATKKRNVPQERWALALFGGNVLIPKEAFLACGGFDETMIGHGGQDCDLGKTLEKMGVKGIFTDEPMGWHIWHPRDQTAHEKSVRKNIEYMEKKHGRYRS